MAVFEGVLDEMSGGSSLSGTATHSGMSGSEKISSMATQGANVTHREFLVIGGKRIMDVNLSNRHDALLVSSIGQNVRISAFKRGSSYMVVGVKLADGTVDKMAVWGSALVNSAHIALPVVVLVVVGYFFGIVFGNPIVAIIAFGLVVVLVRPVLLGTRGMIQARSEL